MSETAVKRANYQKRLSARTGIIYRNLENFIKILKDRKLI